MKDDNKSYLKDEYLHIHKAIIDLDGRMISIKTWSVSFSGASIAGAFVVDSISILWVSILSALAFWVIEAQWKQFQHGFYGRSGEIESFFRGENEDDTPFQIDTYWEKNIYGYKIAKILKTMIKLHVALPHVFIVLVATVIISLVTAGALRL